jgi:hypothetical protein
MFESVRAADERARNGHAAGKIGDFFHGMRQIVSLEKRGTPRPALRSSRPQVLCPRAVSGKARTS